MLRYYLQGVVLPLCIFFGGQDSTNTFCDFGSVAVLGCTVKMPPKKKLKGEDGEAVVLTLVPSPSIILEQLRHFSRIWPYEIEISTVLALVRSKTNWRRRYSLIELRIRKLCR